MKMPGKLKSPSAANLEEGPPFHLVSRAARLWGEGAVQGCHPRRSQLRSYAAPCRCPMKLFQTRKPDWTLEAEDPVP
ncbi:hypothetical protein H920_08222 [Fukomys damarensis]|uniref:Uncharacterized protein n=1 Tax=Fukomys damarensis TaxID=885580 RepID=A0A091DH39_FUKDA|nr:hypothetical protein H920_08222 [Fukomys damarensis]